MTPETGQTERGLIRALSEFQRDVHQLAVEHGFWEHSPSAGEKIALIHSELSEALEWLRVGDPPDPCLKSPAAAVEFADCIIRILDMAEHMGWNVAEAMVRKHEYNKNRPRKHGKEF